MRADFPDGAPFLAGRLDGTPEAVRAHLEVVEDAVRAIRMPEARTTDVLIVLAEVLNNIVEHAFGPRGDGWIDCVIHRLGDGIAIETRDNGAPLPPKLLLTDRAAPELAVPQDEMPEGGFGWFIVHALTDDMMYERMDGTNRLTFSMRAAH